MRYTVNSSGRKTTTVGIPGTGLSYSKSTTKNKTAEKRKSSPAKSSPARPLPESPSSKKITFLPDQKPKASRLFILKTLACFWLGIAVMFIFVGFSLFFDKEIGAGVLALIVSLFFVHKSMKNFKKSKQTQQPINTDNSLQPPDEDVRHDEKMVTNLVTEMESLPQVEMATEQQLLSNLASAENSDDVMNIHYVYNNLIEFYYKHRKSSNEYFDKAIYYCQKDIEIFPTLRPLFINDLHMIPRQPAFQRLAMLYEQRCEYEKSVEICSLAIKYDLADGTQGGFRARRQRIENKLLEKQKL